jgi:hypothetical protein
MTGKKSGANAVDDLRRATQDTREDLGDTVTTLRDRAETKSSTARKAGGWAGAALGVLAGAAAFVVLRWRKARNTPKSRAERAWRDVKSRARKAKARFS